MSKCYGHGESVDKTISGLNKIIICQDRIDEVLLQGKLKQGRKEGSRKFKNKA